MMTPLQGPQVNSDRVYGFAQGSININDIKLPTSGRIFRGTRLEEDFFNAFTKDGKLTLVLNKNYSDFQVAQDVAEMINGQLSFQATGGGLARAINQSNIEVIIPQQYHADPVAFVSGVELADDGSADRSTSRHQSTGRQHRHRRRCGNRPGIVTHKNMVIETADNPNPPPPGFVPLDTANPPPQTTTKLKAGSSRL